MTRQAMHLFKETKVILLTSMSNLGTGSPEEIERSWSACVLYCVSKLSTGSKAKVDDGITLRQILRGFELKIVDFFKEMPQFCIKVGFILTGLYGSDWEKKLELQELQASIVHLCSLGRNQPSGTLCAVMACSWKKRRGGWRAAAGWHRDGCHRRLPKPHRRLASCLRLLWRGILPALHAPAVLPRLPRRRHCSLCLFVPRLESLEAHGFTWISLQGGHSLRRLSVKTFYAYLHYTGRVYKVDTGKFPDLEYLSLRGVQWSWTVVISLLQCASQVKHLVMKIELCGEFDVL